MKTFSVLILLCLSSVGQSLDFCSVLNDNIRFRSTFLWNDNLYVILDNEKVYLLSDFKYFDNKFTFKDVSQLKWERSWLENLKYAFPMNWGKMGPRLIFIDYTEKHQIKQMVGYSMEMDSKGNPRKRLEFNVNQYRYKPNEDPLNLGNLFVKFPEHELQVLLTSMSPIPSMPGYDDRMIVYYREIPIKSRAKDLWNPYEVKRYALYRSVETMDQWSENVWLKDSRDFSCIDLKGIIVNASTYVSVTQHSDHLTCLWLEFFGNRFRLLEMSLSKRDKTITYSDKSSGTIRSMFNCETKSGAGMGAGDGDSKRPDQSESESGISAATIVLIVALVLTAIIIIAILLTYFLVFRPKSSKKKMKRSNAPDF